MNPDDEFEYDENEFAFENTIDFDMDCDYLDDTDITLDDWTIPTALERIVIDARNGKLSKDFWEGCKEPIQYLEKELELKPGQIVIVAILVEIGRALTWHDFGRFLGCPRLAVMKYNDEIEELVKKRWLKRDVSFSSRGRGEGFALSYGVVTACRKNTKFIPEKINELTIQDYIDRITTTINKSISSREYVFKYDEEILLQLTEANQHLPICKKIMEYKDDIHVQSLLLMIIADYSTRADSDGEGVHILQIDCLYPEDYQANGMRRKLYDGDHPLMRDNLIECKCDEGMSDQNRYVLTKHCKEKYLSDYTPTRTFFEGNSVTTGLTKSEDIKMKEMFYNATEEQQIGTLANLLSKEKFADVQNRLEQSGLRKGFACLFYGSPGTGKTETVLQLARQTGRDIMQVDYSEIQDKFVGESEKNVKNIFDSYNAMCKNRKLKPILLFNEADALIGVRTSIGTSNPSIDKMNNSLQNIILQEMEQLEGIMIATTNLTKNMDNAFERRFLYKIEFHNPSVEVKAKLWKSMLKNISDESALSLAHKYDFSGGQIENISRKCSVEYILSGIMPDLNKIEEFCRQEKISQKSLRNPLGFSK